jgi:aminoglycoside phosphotransferase (APT) family kinase protein
VYVTGSTVFPYLQQRGLLTARDLVNHDWFALQPDPRRPVLFVSRVGGNGWVIKQPNPLDSNHVAQLDREAGVYRLAETDSWARPLRHLLARFRAYDSGVHALIIERVAGDTAWSYLRRSSAKPRLLGQLLGRAFSRIHLPVSDRTLPSRLLPADLPWILELDRAAIGEKERPSGVRALELIRGETELLEALSHLKKDWRPQTLIHGDAKLDNAIVSQGPRPSVRVVDWQLAAIGDPDWDLGSLVQSALVLWLSGVAFRADEKFDMAVERSAYSLSLVRSFISSLLTTYLQEPSPRSKRTAATLTRVFRFAGARLVQSAFEHARTEGNFTRRHLAMLQMSLQLLQDPDGAAEDLLQS